MAKVSELQELRDLGPSLDADDSVLGALIDQLGVNGALAHLWAARAAATATLVDVTESGSSRKMSGIHNQAKSLADRYRGLADAENAVVPVSGTVTLGTITR